MYTYSFEKLGVWQDARKFTVFIYKITAGFPVEEKFGLTNQLRRAAVSIAANIAEGSGRISLKDQAHFYQIAFSSTIEVLSHLLIAFDLNFISDKILAELRIKLEEITNKINALRNSILKKL
jgi:four helix bundle protein